jgi:hypothetical protein
MSERFALFVDRFSSAEILFVYQRKFLFEMNSEKIVQISKTEMSTKKFNPLRSWCRRGFGNKFSIAHESS